MLTGLAAARVQCVVVGGVAMRASGSSFRTDDLDICYDTAADNLHRLVTLLASWNAYPRGWDPKLPFVLDARTFRITPLLTLVTTEGALDLLDLVAGVGDYRACKQQADEVVLFGCTTYALSLDALISAKRARGRPKDRLHLVELEAIRELRRKSTRA